MAKKGEVIHLVKNIKNGGIYRIGEEKLRKEPGEWEMYIPPVEEKIDVSPMTANEIKIALKEKGVEFKGNASTESLQKLLDES